MKTIITYILLMTVPVIFTNCSSDDDVPQTINANSEDIDDLPLEPSPANTAFELPGYPGIIKKYENGKLNYWAQYYYRPDGNLLKINYSHPESSPEVFTDSFYYNSAGKLLKIDGHDVYDFYWEGDRIVEVGRYNGMWSGRSKIQFEYNARGQIIEKKETNIDFLDKEKLVYYYFDDGNLKMIEQYGDYNVTGIYTLYFVTKFEGYTNDKNLFWELEIIPRQVAQNYFPTAMNFKHLTETGYDKQEIYNYQYDSQGRVIEKTFGKNRIIYLYY
ncbi:hypothetical protein G3I01_11590 [Gramella sp. MT6]|uniref:hypothetical protein n=1 Tax=Gramella sp. MT6 TaxID=2705471 RepID=UPI001C5FBB5C|nr:hypothetical protein [Gramella sp. MT6]QYA26130.1 hypothetical protein G3I01_11590 [Gramella sp. MT6]